MPERERDKNRGGHAGERQPAGRQFPVRPAFATPVPGPSSPIPGTVPAYPPPTFHPAPPLPTPTPPGYPSPPAYLGGYPAPPAGMPTPTPWGYPAGTWAPRADVYQENGDYVIITDVPGIDIDTLDLTWDGGELILEASIRSPERPDRKPLVRERPTGSYYRRIPLGPDLDPAGAVASYCDGILEVRVPRKRRRTGRGKTVRVKRPEE
ncbi:MAG: Hsp20/alpha crystallin family protein [Bacillota bacterium]